MLMELKLRSLESLDRVVVAIVASGITSMADWLGRYLSSGISSIATVSVSSSAVCVSTVSVVVSIAGSGSATDSVSASAYASSGVSANAAKGLGVPTVAAVGVTTFGVPFITPVGGRCVD